MKNLSTEEIVSRLVSSTDPVERQTLYQQWAETYDSDLAEYGYVAPVLSVTQFCKALTDKNAFIYDAGCGTGLVGKLLNERGYKTLTGADISPDMLAVAEKTDCYTSLGIADYTQQLPIESDTYDAIISVGVYTARFENIFIPEMLRILKPEGVLLFTCRPQYFESSVQPEVQKLLTTQVVQSVSIERKPYMLQQGAEAFYVMIQPMLPAVELA